MFKTFCCSFYGSPLWGFNSVSFRKKCSTWNIDVRSIFNLPYRAHTFFLAHYCNNRMSVNNCILEVPSCNSCNSIVQSCFMNSLYNSNSVIGSKIAYFRAKYHINFTTSTRSRIMSNIRVTVPTED